MEAIKPKGKKAGRPVQAVKKSVRAAVRYSKAEYFVIKQKAKEAGVKVSVYIRELTINGSVKARINQEERHFVRQLIGMANNLNQLVKTCHKEGILKAVLYFENYRNQLDELLQKLKND